MYQSPCKYGARPRATTALNDLDRFHLAGDVIDHVERLRNGVFTSA
jgi:hypothetical protein